MSDLDGDRIGPEGLVGGLDQARAAVDIDIGLGAGEVGDFEAGHLHEALAFGGVDDLQQLGLVRPARVDDEGFGVDRNIPDGFVGVGVHDIRQRGLVERQELVDGALAQGGLEGQRGQRQVAVVDARDGERAQTGRVQPDDVLIDVRVQPVDHDQLAEQAIAESFTDQLEGGGLLQRLAGGRQRQLAGVDDRAAEEGPLGDQLIDVVGDEHAVGVDPVARALPRSRGVGQDEAQAA